MCVYVGVCVYEEQRRGATRRQGIMDANNLAFCSVNVCPYTYACAHTHTHMYTQEGKPVKVLIGTTKLAGGDKILENIAGMPNNGVRIAAAAAFNKK
jgi:hypothetical protein